MFSSPPVVIANIQTTNNETGNPAATNPTPWLTAALRNVTAPSMQYSLERFEVDTGAVTVSETMGYVLIEAGASGSLTTSSGTVSYEAQTTGDTVEGWTDGCYSTNFASSFTVPPLVVATKNSHEFIL
jgi:hypothetical protein